MGTRDAGEASLFLSIYMLGQVATAYALSATLRMRSEEADGRADRCRPPGSAGWAGR
jgi:hypothetical protein